MEPPNKYHKLSTHEVIPAYEVILPNDVCRTVISFLNPQDVLALSSTCRKWQVLVRGHFTQKIVSFFGRMFPLPIAVRLWVPPFEAQTQLIARLPPRRDGRSILVGLCNAIPNGTIDEIKELISFVKDRTQFKPFLPAVKSGRLDVVRLLVESGFSFGVDNNEIPSSSFSPLYCAVEQNKTSIVHYFLQNGASLNVGFPGEPLKLFHRCMLSCPQLHCAALLIRSWMNETGLTTLQDDKHLPSIAGVLINGPWQTAALLMNYGVIPERYGFNFRERVATRIALGEKQALEFMRTRSLLDYQTFVYDGNSLSDLAAQHGQFELEDLFVRVHKVPYNKTKSENHSSLQKSIYYNFKHCFNNGPYKWESILERIDHYQLDINIRNNHGPTSGIDQLFDLIDVGGKAVLQPIQDLIDRKGILRPEQVEEYNMLLIVLGQSDLPRKPTPGDIAFQKFLKQLSDDSEVVESLFHFCKNHVISTKNPLRFMCEQVVQKIKFPGTAEELFNLLVKRLSFTRVYRNYESECYSLLLETHENIDELEEFFTNLPYQNLDINLGPRGKKILRDIYFKKLKREIEDEKDFNTHILSKLFGNFLRDIKLAKIEGPLTEEEMYIIKKLRYTYQITFVEYYPTTGIQWSQINKCLGLDSRLSSLLISVDVGQEEMQVRL